MNDPLTEWKFAAIADAESKRTVVCSPERVDGIRAAIAAAGLEHRFTVQASRLVPSPSTVLVIDTSVMEGAEREAAQRWLQEDFPFFNRPDSFPGGVS